MAATTAHYYARSKHPTEAIRAAVILGEPAINENDAP
jgi:hypothetical protein